MIIGHDIFGDTNYLHVVMIDNGRMILGLVHGNLCRHVFLAPTVFLRKGGVLLFDPVYHIH